jgi:hypothetical protein
MTQFYRMYCGEMTNQVVFSIKVSGDDFDLIKGKIALTSIKAAVKKGKKFYDLLRFYEVPLNYALSANVRDVLIRSKCTGWSTYELKITGHADKAYFGLQISGKSGNIDSPEEEGFIDGMSFDVPTWDGSDFFCPGDTGMIFCTAKVKKAIEDNKLTNFHFVEIDKVRWYNAGEQSED